MVQAIAHERLLPFKYVVAACLYGNSPDFLDAVDACVGGTTCVAIPSETRCWLQRPCTEGKPYAYKPMVLVFDKPNSYIGLLQTKLSHREGHEARRIGE
jgi:hypothetical protein